ncbi:MAG: hypothetical protein KDF65_06790 [Anaerolineae bacterium]|nr:hypothetical protein [Anaerolineae bacterium]
MSLPTILLIAAAVSLGAMALAVIISFRSEREARSAIFPIVREEETIRAQRARLNIFVWAAVSALFLGGWLASLRLIETPVAPVAEIEPTPAEAVVEVSSPPAEIAAPETAAEQPAAEVEQPVALLPTESPTPFSPTNTPAPIATVEAIEPSPTAEPATTVPTATPTLLPPTPTDTPAPTATNTPLPTATATATNTPSPTPFLSALMSSNSTPRTPAPSGAKMGPIELSAEITDEIEAVNPASTFPDETEVIYAVFPYSGMQDGVDFRVIWYQNGIELWRDETQWQWGDQARFFSFFRDPNQGLYKVELQVNDSVLASKLFEVR